jgi:hypothetical protein
MFKLKIGALKDDVASIVSGGQFEFSSESNNLFGEFHSLHLVHFVIGISLRIRCTFYPKWQTEELMLAKLQLFSILLGQIFEDCALKCGKSLVCGEALRFTGFKERWLVLVQISPRGPSSTSCEIALRLSFEIAYWIVIFGDLFLNTAARQNNQLVLWLFGGHSIFNS